MLENSSEQSNGVLSNNNTTENFKDWKKFDYYIVFSFTSVLFLQIFLPFLAINPLDNSYSIEYIFSLPQIYGFFPIIFDIAFIYYFKQLYNFYKQDDLLIILSARWYRLKYLRGISYFFVFYLLLLILFSPKFNPLFILNISGSYYPAFSIAATGSLILTCIQLILLKFNKLNSSFITVLRIHFLFFAILALSDLVIPITDFFNYSYLLPLLYLLYLQIFLYKFTTKNMTSEELNNTLINNQPPSWLMITAGLYPSKEDYQEALEKGCKNMNQLTLVRKYGADNYKTALDVMERDFPSYKMYKEAFNQGFYSYREWKKYLLKIGDEEVINEVLVDKKKFLRGLLSKTNRIYVKQIEELLDLPNSKPLLKWLGNLPDEYPIRLDGEAIVFEQLTRDQLNYIVDNLFLLSDLG